MQQRYSAKETCKMGMVGVIAQDRRRSVSVSEIDALATIYESFRGPGRRHAVNAGDYARVIKIDSTTSDRPGIEQENGSWVAVTGTVHADGSLVGQDIRLLDGQFGLVAYDRPSNTVVVGSDPFGLHAFYIAEQDGKTYLSTSALTLARHLQAKPNRLGLALLLCTGVQSGSITHWEGIERLDPATCLTFSENGYHRSIYWRLEVDDAMARLNFQQAVDRSIETITDVFRKHLGSKPEAWSDLTGGYDTRLLTGLLSRAGVDFRANTNGGPQSPDVRLARRIARVTGWDWTHFRLSKHWEEMVWARLPQALAWADGRLPVVQLAQVLWGHEQKSTMHDTVFAGSGGEIFRGWSWRQEFLRAGRSTRVNYNNLISMIMMGKYRSSLISATYSNDVEEYLRSWMKAKTEPYSDRLNVVQLDSLLAARCPEWHGIYGSAAGAFLRSELPFLFKSVFVAGFSINYRHRNSHRLMRAMIERIDPRLAAIPTTTGGTAQSLRLTNLHQFAPYYGRLFRTAITKLSQEILGHGLLARTHLDDPRVVAGRRAVLRHMDFASNTMYSAELFEEPALRAFLGRANEPDFHEGAMLDRILTIELLVRASRGQGLLGA